MDGAPCHIAYLGRSKAALQILFNKETNPAHRSYTPRDLLEAPEATTLEITFHHSD